MSNDLKRTRGEEATEQVDSKGANPDFAKNTEGGQ